MRPLKLVMQAFGSYGNRTEIDFEKPDQNLFLITGKTGSGKTTIFDAIVFALYGEASSNANKKNGAELQSQFVEIGTEPFVSLTFSEKNGTETDLYTVKRIPRHLRPLKRGSGEKMVSEEVSLTMPDGSEYSQKETDAKLLEIVGLTKEQFMQVAMIAQGEFMELLRAKSDDKKMIFRKLFHTGLYEEIKNEFAVRKKEKQAEIDQIRMRCIAEISRTELPEDSEYTAFLKEKKKELEKSKDFSVTVLEQFLEKLELLCEELSKRTKEAKKIVQKRSQERDHARDAAAKASQLLKFFVQLEEAEKNLQILKSQEETTIKQQELAVQIEDAWEVQAVYQRFSDCKNAGNIKVGPSETDGTASETYGRYKTLYTEYKRCKTSAGRRTCSLYKNRRKSQKSHGSLCKAGDRKTGCDPKRKSSPKRGRKDQNEKRTSGKAAGGMEGTLTAACAGGEKFCLLAGKTERFRLAGNGIFQGRTNGE